LSKKIYDILILGAGASGLMVALGLKERDIALIDANSKIAQKIKISGGGKCNITNEFVSSDNYLGDREFVKEILDSFNEKDLLDFFSKKGVQFLKRKDSQYFCKDSSEEIIDIFRNEIKNTQLFLNEKVINVEKENNIFKLICEGKNFFSKSLIVASGGLSYSKIGASDIGYKIAKKFGHKINTLNPALVGFTLQPDQAWMKTLSGISTKVTIKVANKVFKGDMLFAHKGISGPVILNASLYWQKGTIEIDFLPEFSFEKNSINSNKFISSLLPLPKRFVKEFLNAVCIEDKAVSTLTSQELKILKSLKSYIFAPAGNFGYTKAEVTKGGICTSLIDSQTMMSRCENGLYFIGECLDVTGELGGYNLQWALSSAMRVKI
jgi:predicted Rossmann fold flavoprotein